MSCFCFQDISCFFTKETTKTMNDGDIKHLTNDGRMFQHGGHVSSRITVGNCQGVCHLANVHKTNPAPGHPPPKKKNDRIPIAMIPFCTTIVDPSNHEPPKNSWTNLVGRFQGPSHTTDEKTGFFG